MGNMCPVFVSICVYNTLTLFMESFSDLASLMVFYLFFFLHCLKCDNNFCDR